MATGQYLSGRRKYSRPQGMLWSENPGYLDNGRYVPDGYEIGQSADNQGLLNQFIILSDDNREPIDFSIERIEKRERMINGRMRSYHIADKLSIKTSWKMLPSRSFSTVPNFNDLGSPTNSNSLPINNFQYTSDGGAGGAELLKWYEEHKGPFWVFLAYDKNDNFSNTDDQYGKLDQYNEVIEMYITDFSYSVQRRGGTNFDFWDISVSLEEV